ncbi:ABC transporter ATP-binding protein/permease [Simiduia curdlanivorans]|uniref:ABCB family ABC transporter ATP-binding protein/permease n=1 Tax=Simiduia curdlanivorans TaxID=1492769 RepID=A0ABV8V468_9GAMM|nr:ABC transporter ATP-binding protein/permease [Simiduia curdlanivorans]MDN3637445.1 ABC transporter ATP-binding protein/permease [Simiduia curdlanivorans]
MRHSKHDVEPGQISWTTLKTLVPYLLEHRLRIGLALAFLIGAKLASVGLPFILKYLVDDLSAAGDAASVLALPLGLLLAYGAVRLANVLFGELRDTLFGRVTERAMRRIGLQVFEHLHHLDLAFHLDRRTGGLSRDIERGNAGISFLLRFMVFNIVPTLLEVGMVIVILLINYDVGFALITLVSIVAYVAYSIWATEWRTGFIRQANKAESASSARAVDSLLNFETVKYFGNERYEAKCYDTELAAWEQARRSNRLSLFALNGGQAFIVAGAMTAMMVLAAVNVRAGAMTIGDFVLVNAFMMQIFMPLNFLGFVYREMKGAFASIEHMFELLKLKPKVIDAEDAQPLTVAAGRLVFDKVCFSYSPERPILRDLSFVVEPKQKVAIVGASGAGKSTLFKLLFRFYERNSGLISIDGQDIATVTQASLRAALGVVPQDTVLFNGSIVDNIRYGRIGASDQDIQEAIALSHLQPFIEQLPQGWDTLVGERGLKLSGGEKQRVAIARTLLKRPPIWIFDEATSSLDSHAEKSILSAIDRVSTDHTALVIAHRLSTVVNADKIIVLDKGAVVEQGDHLTLLALGGQYARLWQAQQAGV